jgi:hypothetical protein
MSSRTSTTPTADIVGSLDTATLLSDGSAYFSGWALSLANPGTPVSWFLFQGPRIILSGRTAGVRNDVAAAFGPAAAMSSFEISSPEFFGDDLETPITLIAISKGASVASCGRRPLTDQRK